MITPPMSLKKSTEGVRIDRLQVEALRREISRLCIVLLLVDLRLVNMMVSFTSQLPFSQFEVNKLKFHLCITLLLSVISLVHSDLSDDFLKSL